MPIFQSKREYRAGNGKRFRHERRSSSPGAAGVSPPWFGEPGAVRLQPRSVRRRPERQPRAAGVSPPWVSVSHFTTHFTTALALTHGRPPRVPVPVAGAFASRLTTGGLRPPLLRCGANVCRRKTIFAMHKRTFDRERRASARRGPVNRALCRRSRVLFSGDRSDNQERRVSARRGSQNRTL
jgi:hypothetical protein